MADGICISYTLNFHFKLFHKIRGLNLTAYFQLSLMSKFLYLEYKRLKAGINGYRILPVIGNIDPWQVIMIFPE
jgi:hypothetical protein